MSGNLPDTHPTLPDNPRHGHPLSGGVGYLSGDSPDKGFCDKERHKPLLEGCLSGLSGGFSGECVDPLLAGYLPGTAGYLPGEVSGTDFADGEGGNPPLEGDLPGLPGGFSGG